MKNRSVKTLTARTWDKLKISASGAAPCPLASLSTALVLVALCLNFGCTATPKAPEPKVGVKTGEPAPSGSSGGDTSSSAKGSGAAASTAEVKYEALSQALRSGRTQAVQEEASKILVGHPEDVTALNALAMWNYKQGKLGAAKLLLARAIEKGEPNAAVLNNFGLMLLAEGDELLAAEQFKKAIRLDERHAEANANLGAHYAKGGDWKRALPRLETAYKAGRMETAIANNYAISLRALGELDKSKSIFEEAMKRNNKDAILLLNYAALLIESMNRPKEGLPLVYRVKFLETERKDVLTRANQLERRASQSDRPAEPSRGALDSESNP